MIPKGWNWKDPDYAPVFAQRMKSLHWLREDVTNRLPVMKNYYRLHPADFISDWGVTFDPRLGPDGITVLPFILFDAQRDWIETVIRKWRAKEPLITEKSRDGGFTWLAISLACTLCLFNDGIAIGFGSRKAEYVDQKDGMKAIIPKGRMFMRNIPEEFRGNWIEWRDSPLMRINFPDTGSLIGGEGGDDIGRGDRTSIYFVDESSHIKHAEDIDASLSQTTNCRIDVSSVRGMNNTFAKKRHEGKIEVFVFDWREDPRKDEAWYAKQCDELDPVVVAQEIDRDHSASLEGIVIPNTHVKSALNAMEKLGIATGAGDKWLALDIADEGKDKIALCGGQGIAVTHLEEWSGKGSDIHATMQRAIDYADEHGFPILRYDADGMGANGRGAARIINDQRIAAGKKPIAIEAFRGSAGVVDPEGIVDGTIGLNAEDKGRTNQDYFANCKAQSWHSLARKFLNTYRWVVLGKPCDPADIISISLPPVTGPGGVVKPHPLQFKLITELSQPTRQTNGVGKMLIDKTPKNVKSPNLGDSLMMGKARLSVQPLIITTGMMQQIVAAGSRAGRARNPRRFRGY